MISRRLLSEQGGNTLSATSSFCMPGNVTHSRTQTFTYDQAGRPVSWRVSLNGREAGASVTYGNYGLVATEKYLNEVKRKYQYDCHGWVKEITTTIPALKMVDPVRPVFPDLPVAPTFYSQVLDSPQGNKGETGETGAVKIPAGTDYTETILYADGSTPRYDGTASAHVSTLGGRYDYTFDVHDRLIGAAYTPGADANAEEDFSASYVYNSVGAPTSVTRYGVTNLLKGPSGETAECYGLLDKLTYYWDRMQLSSIESNPKNEYGSDFVGRTGWPLSPSGMAGGFGWNNAGLLTSDTSRDIQDITYNHAGQPEKISLNRGFAISYTYDSSGKKCTETTTVQGQGSIKRILNRKTYCEDFIFEGDSLVMVNFAGGYFDGEGRAHYHHKDWQGSVTMVTDATSKLVQHTGYFPYGEPWREPSGQPYLFGEKERLREGGLNEYDFGPRRLNSAALFWDTPDPLAFDTPMYNPYVYCAANPIKFIDPSGCAHYLNSLTGDYLGSDNDPDSDKEFRLISPSDFETIVSSEDSGPDLQNYKEELLEKSRIITMDEVSITDAVMKMVEETKEDELEHQLFINLDTKNSKITIEIGPKGQPDRTPVEWGMNKTLGISYTDANQRHIPPFTILIGQIHTHPLIDSGGRTNYHGVSELDEWTAKEAGITVFAVEAFGKGTIHQVTSNGKTNNSAGNMRKGFNFALKALMHYKR